MDTREPDRSDAVSGLQNEEQVFRPLSNIVSRANVTPQEYAAALHLASADLEAYWEEAAEELGWFKRWDKVLDDSEAPFYRWFVGGRCNVIYNCLDRHIDTPNKNKLALIWEGEPGDLRKYTYYELYREVNRFAAALRKLGLKPGDKVVIYMPNLPETVIAMLATAKIGAVHSVVFAGYSSKALAERIQAAEAKAVITCDGYYRNGQVLRPKPVVDKALERLDPRLAEVEFVVVAHRAHVETPMQQGRDHWFDDLVRFQAPEALTEVMDAEDPLFFLYTSGVAGKPKGMVHAHGGFMVGVHRTLDWVFDIKPTDIFWCTADAGWVTGHSYAIYGPLMTGATVVMYEGHPLYPQADRVWRLVSRYGITILYASPTLIRMLMRFGVEFPAGYDLSTLRLLGSVGEPFNREAWMWFYKVIGRQQCPIMDTWWQTETGMFMISPLPISLLKPGSVGKPLPGVEADIVNASGEPLPPETKGLLVIKKPWPSMFRELYKDPEAYKREYWEKIPGCYYAGDVAWKDEDGYFWIQGRADDVVNIAGHRIGSAELESAVLSHPDVVEAAAVGVSDPVRGEAVKFFVVARHGAEKADELPEALKAHVRQELGPMAVVQTVEIVDSLPKTCSGKILRRALKARELGMDLDDLPGLDED
jgi:acetyl-CoA synthetase